MERELGVAVEQHDDGSASRMHDLHVVGGETMGAAEVTTAADSETIEFWNVMNRAGERWQVATLVGGWFVAVEPSARVKRLRQELPDFLKRLEVANVRAYRMGRGGTPIDEAARELRLLRARQSETSFPGSIYVTPHLPIERLAGFAAPNGDALPAWVGPFLQSPERHDVREKLARSGLPERHAFVIFPQFTPAPFHVVDILIRDDAPQPTADPVLPEEVTDVWAVSAWAAGWCFRWSRATGWLRFSKR